MNENASTQFEVHDREALANARAIMNATESPRAWAQEVIQAVKRNEESGQSLVCRNSIHRRSGIAMRGVVEDSIPL